MKLLKLATSPNKVFDTKLNFPQKFYKWLFLQFIFIGISKLLYLGEKLCTRLLMLSILWYFENPEL